MPSFLDEYRKAQRPGGDAPLVDELDTDAITKTVDTRLAKEATDYAKGQQKATQDAQKQRVRGMKEAGYTVVHDADGNPTPLTAPNGGALRRKFNSAYSEDDKEHKIWVQDLENGGHKEVTGKTVDKRGHMIDALGRDVGTDPEKLQRLANSQLVEQGRNALVNQKRTFAAEPKPDSGAAQTLKRVTNELLAAQQGDDKDVMIQAKIAKAQANVDAAKAAVATLNDYNSRRADINSRLGMVGHHASQAKAGTLAPADLQSYKDLVNPPQEPEGETGNSESTENVTAPATAPAIQAPTGTNAASTGQQATTNSAAQLQQTQAVAPGASLAEAPTPTPAPPPQLTNPEAVAALPIEQHAAAVKSSEVALANSAAALQQKQAVANAPLVAVEQKMQAWQAKNAMAIDAQEPVEVMYHKDGTPVVVAEAHKEELQNLYNEHAEVSAKLQGPQSEVSGAVAAFNKAQADHNAAVTTLNEKVAAERKSSDDVHTASMAKLREDTNLAPFADKLDALRSETQKGSEEVSKTYPEGPAREAAFKTFQDQQEGKRKVIHDEVKKARRNDDKEYGHRVEVGGNQVGIYNTFNDKGTPKATINFVKKDAEPLTIDLPKITDEDIDARFNKNSAKIGEAVGRMHSLRATADNPSRSLTDDSGGLSDVALETFISQIKEEADRLRDENQKILKLGKKFFYEEAVKDELKKPEHADKFEGGGLGMRMVAGAAKSAIETGIAVHRALGADDANENLKKLLEADAATGQAFQGSLQRELTGGVWNKALVSGAESVGMMATTAIPAGGGARLATKLAGKSVEALGGLAPALAMAPTSFGGGFSDYEQQAQQLEASGQPEEAAKIRSMRDVKGITSALIDTLTEQMSMGHAPFADKGGLIKALRGLPKEILGEANEEFVAQVVGNAIEPLVSQGVNNPTLFEGAIEAALAGALAAGPISTFGAVKEGFSDRGGQQDLTPDPNAPERQATPEEAAVLGATVKTAASDAELDAAPPGPEKARAMTLRDIQQGADPADLVSSELASIGGPPRKLGKGPVPDVYLDDAGNPIVSDAAIASLKTSFPATAAMFRPEADTKAHFAPTPVAPPAPATPAVATPPPVVTPPPAPASATPTPASVTPAATSVTPTPPSVTPAPVAKPPKQIIGTPALVAATPAPTPDAQHVKLTKAVGGIVQSLQKKGVRIKADKTEAASGFEYQSDNASGHPENGAITVDIDKILTQTKGATIADALAWVRENIQDHELIHSITDQSKDVQGALDEVWSKLSAEEKRASAEAYHRKSGVDFADDFTGKHEFMVQLVQAARKGKVNEALLKILKGKDAGFFATVKKLIDALISHLRKLLTDKTHAGHEAAQKLLAAFEKARAELFKKADRKYAVNPVSDFIHDERSKASQKAKADEWRGAQEDKITASDIISADHEKIVNDIDKKRRGMTVEKARVLVQSAADAGAIPPQWLKVLMDRLDKAFPPTVDTAAHEAATSPKNDLPEPSEAEKEAENHKVGRLHFGNTKISVETPAGAKRRPEWPALKDHYGRILGTTGADSTPEKHQHLDAIVKEGTPEGWDGPVFVVNQKKSDGSFDEHKIVFGASSGSEAATIYKRNYSKDWKGFGGLVEFSNVAAFEAWAADPANTTKKAVSVNKPVDAAPVNAKTGEMDYPPPPPPPAYTPLEQSETEQRIRGSLVHVDKSDKDLLARDPRAFMAAEQTRLSEKRRLLEELEHLPKTLDALKTRTRAEVERMHNNGDITDTLFYEYAKLWNKTPRLGPDMPEGPIAAEPPPPPALPPEIEAAKREALSRVPQNMRDGGLLDTEASPAIVAEVQKAVADGLLPNFTMPERKRSLSMLRDIIVARLDEIENLDDDTVNDVFKGYQYRDKPTGDLITVAGYAQAEKQQTRLEGLLKRIEAKLAGEAVLAAQDKGEKARRETADTLNQQIRAEHEESMAKKAAEQKVLVDAAEAEGWKVSRFSEPAKKKQRAGFSGWEVTKNGERRKYGFSTQAEAENWMLKVRANEKTRETALAKEMPPPVAAKEPTKWNVKLAYLDNPAGPNKGSEVVEQDEKPVKGAMSSGRFGRARIVAVTRFKEAPKEVVPEWKSLFDASKITARQAVTIRDLGEHVKDIAQEQQAGEKYTIITLTTGERKMVKFDGELAGWSMPAQTTTSNAPTTSNQPLPATTTEGQPTASVAAEGKGQDATYKNGLPRPSKTALTEAKRLGVVIEPYMHGVYDPEPAFKVYASTKPDSVENTNGTTTKDLISNIRIVAERAGHGDGRDGAGFKVKGDTEWRESERARLQQEVDDRMDTAAAPDPNKLVFDKDYTGPRFTYGMRYRPLGLGAQPKGWIVDSLRDSPNFRHGTIQYPRELTADELRSFELERVEDAPTAPIERSADETPQEWDDVTWTDGAGHEAVARLEKIMPDGTGRVEHFGTKFVPLDALKLYRKSTQRLRRENPPTTAPVAALLKKVEADAKRLPDRAAEAAINELVADVEKVAATAKEETREVAKARKALKDTPEHAAFVASRQEAVADALKAAGFERVAFSLRGGGSFKLWNTKETLTSFAKKLQQRIGETKPVVALRKPPETAAVVKHAGGERQALAMLERQSEVTKANGDEVDKMTYAMMNELQNGHRADGSMRTQGKQGEQMWNFSDEDALTVGARLGMSDKVDTKTSMGRARHSLWLTDKQIKDAVRGGLIVKVAHGDIGIDKNATDELDFYYQGGKAETQSNPPPEKPPDIEAIKKKLTTNEKLTEAERDALVADQAASPKKFVVQWVDGGNNKSAPYSEASAAHEFVKELNWKKERGEPIGGIQIKTEDATEPPATPSGAESSPTTSAQAPATALQALAASEGTEWARKGRNIVKPGFNTHWTPEEKEAIAKKFREAGMSIGHTGTNGQRMPSAFFLDSESYRRLDEATTAHGFDVREKAKADAKNKKAAADAAKLATADPKAIAWLEDTFGKDFANAYNKVAFADYLSGKSKKFEGGTQPKWREGLEKLGALSGSVIDYSKIKAAYQAGTRLEAQPISPDHEHDDTSGKIPGYATATSSQEQRHAIARMAKRLALRKWMRAGKTAPALHQTEVRFGTGEPEERAEVSPSDDGKLTIHLAFGDATNEVGQHVSEAALRKRISDAVDEEFIHASDYTALGNEWRRNGKPSGFGEFAQKRAIAALTELTNIHISALDAVKQRIDALVDASRSLYYEPKKYTDGLAGIFEQLRATKNVRIAEKFVGELVRKIVQLNRFGALTETGWKHASQRMEPWSLAAETEIRNAHELTTNGTLGAQLQARIAATHGILDQMQGTKLEAPPVDTPSEMPPDAVGTRRAFTDSLRENEGWLPYFSGETRTFKDVVWPEALAAIKANPDAGKELVDELLTEPRVLDDVDRAVITHEFLTRKKAFDFAVDAVEAATNEADRLKAQQRLATARDNYFFATEAANLAGSEAGRALNAIRLALKEDFSLARLLAVQRAIKGGPLSEEEEKEITELQAKYQAVADKLEAKIAENAELKGQLAALRTAGEVAPAKPKLMKDAAQKALERLKARRGKVVAAGPINNDVEFIHTSDPLQSTLSEVEKHLRSALDDAVAEANDKLDEPAKNFNSRWKVTKGDIDETGAEAVWYADASIPFRVTPTWSIEKRKDIYEVKDGNGKAVYGGKFKTFAEAEADAKQGAFEQFLQENELSLNDRKEATWPIFDAFTPPAGFEGEWVPSGGMSEAGSFYGEFSAGEDRSFKLRISDHEQLSRQHRAPDKTFLTNFTPEGVKERLIDAYKWLEKRAKKSPVLEAPPINDDFNDLATFGASLVEDGISDITAFSKAIETVLPGLLAEHDAGKVFAESKRLFKAATAAEAKASTVEGVSEKIKTKRDSIDELTDADLNKLALALIQHEGVRDVDAMRKRMHAIVAGIFPGATQSDVARAWTRADSEATTSDQHPDKVLLRDLKRQSLAIERHIMVTEEHRRPPQIGFHRDNPSDEARKLERKLSDAIRDAPDLVDDDTAKKQLASAQDKLKTALTNRRNDLQKQVDAEEREVRSTTSIKETEDIKKLREEIKELNKKLDIIDPRNTGPTDAQKIKMAESAAVRSITKLQNEVDELDRKIKANDLSVASKKTPLTSDKLAQLRADRKKLAKSRDDLKERLEDMRAFAAATEPPDPVMAALGRLVHRQDTPTAQHKRIKSRLETLAKDYLKQPTTTFVADAVEYGMKQADAQDAQLILDAEIKRRDLLRLHAWKRRAQRVIENNAAKANAFDEDMPLTKTPKQLELDAEQEALATAKVASQNEVLRAQQRMQLRNRPGWQKVLQAASRISTNFAIGGYHTAAKLISYDVGKGIEAGLSELASSLLSMPYSPFRSLMKAADMEGEAFTGLTKFYGKAFTQGLKEAWTQLTTGDSPTHTRYDRPEMRPLHWDDYFGGNFHQAEKTPLLVGSEALYYEKALASAKRRGDIKEIGELERHKIAYEYGKRMVLMEQNWFADWMRKFFDHLEKPKKETGKPGPIGNAVSTVIKMLLTKDILKVPANYVRQTYERSPLGFAEGLARWAATIPGGAETLPPVVANHIARLLKYGLIGSAVFVYALFDATKDEKDRMFGGYYQPGEKRHPEDVPVGGLRIGGKNISHWLLHNPLFEIAQLASTIIRVARGKSSKHADPHGYMKGALAATLGLVRQAPVVGNIPRLEDLGDANKKTHIVGDMVASLVPAIVANYAQDTDHREGEPVKRNPKDILDSVKLRLPVFRQQVEEKGGNFDEWGFRKGLPHEHLLAEDSFKEHNRLHPTEPWHVPQVGPTALYKLPDEATRDAFKMRVAELTRRLSKTGIPKVKNGDIVTRVDPISDYEATHPTATTKKKVDSYHRSAYKSASSEFKARFGTKLPDEDTEAPYRLP